MTDRQAKDARAKLELKKTKTQKLAPKRRKKKDANKVKVISYEKDEDAKLERRKVKVRSFVNPGTVGGVWRLGWSGKAFKGVLLCKRSHRSRSASEDTKGGGPPRRGEGF